MSELSEDKRAIACITYDDEDGSAWYVGQGGVTRIEPYDEYGEMAPVPWLAVYKAEFVLARVPARKVTVVYQEPVRISASDFEVDDLIADGEPGL